MISLPSLPPSSRVGRFTTCARSLSLSLPILVLSTLMYSFPAAQTWFANRASPDWHHSVQVTLRMLMQMRGGLHDYNDT